MKLHEFVAYWSVFLLKQKCFNTGEKYLNVGIELFPCFAMLSIIAAALYSKLEVTGKLDLTDLSPFKYTKNTQKQLQF